MQVVRSLFLAAQPRPQWSAASPAARLAPLSSLSSTTKSDLLPLPSSQSSSSFIIKDRQESSSALILIHSSLGVFGKLVPKASDHPASSPLAEPSFPPCFSSEASKDRNIWVLTRTGPRLFLLHRTLNLHKAHRYLLLSSIICPRHFISLTLLEAFGSIWTASGYSTLETERVPREVRSRNGRNTKVCLSAIMDHVELTDLQPKAYLLYLRPAEACRSRIGAGGPWS